MAEEIPEKEIEVKRDIQQFMNDMRMIGEQVNSRELAKPTFHYGDLAVTNYLLWLMLGEIADLNTTINEEAE